MSQRSILVVGAEGSGTTLLWNCIVRHPQLQAMKAWVSPAASGPLPSEDVILHLSLPTLRPVRWFGGWSVARGARVVVMRRSPLHTVFSAYRRFYRAPRPAWRNYLRAVALEASWIARHEPLCVSYEDLVHNPAAVLRRVYEFLGVDTSFAPPIEISDQNDERWRQDPHFALFVRRAFGTDRKRASDESAPVVTLDFRSHGTRISVEDASGAGVAEALRAALPPDLEPPGTGSPGAEYTVERHTSANGTIGYRIVARGEVRLRTRDKARLVHWLRGEIDELVAESSRTSLFVHAGVVGWRGHAILIPGRTMSGKSRLVNELVRCGATYYSDEFAVFDDEGRVLPYARQTVLRDAGVAVDLGTRDAAEPLPVGLIVSTSYRAGASWQPREVRGVRAVVPIIDNTVLARRETRQLLQLSAKIAPRAVTLQGPRAEAVEVAPRLLAYLDELLDGGAKPEPGASAAAVIVRAQAALEAAAGPTPEEVLPPRYLRIDDFLGEEEHARLLAYALGRELDFAVSTVLDPSGVRKVDDQFRRSATLFDIDEIWDLFETRLRRLLPLVRRELELPWFPLGQIERQMAVHRQGDFFGRHSDAGGAAVAARRVTGVYYFHARPKRFSGGELRIHERLVRSGDIEPGPGHVVVQPEDNAVVFFSSDTPHEVGAVSHSSGDFGGNRFSLTFWFWLGTNPACLEAAAGCG